MISNLVRSCLLWPGVECRRGRGVSVAVRHVSWPPAWRTAATSAEVAADVGLPAVGAGRRVDAGGEPISMHDRVMSPAQQGEVARVRGAAIDPVLDMVGIAPMRRRPATRERAAAVAPPQRGELGRRGEPRAAPEVEQLAAAVDRKSVV